jgi:hypothetical protein
MGNLYVRFDEGEGSAKSRPSLLYCSKRADVFTIYGEWTQRKVGESVRRNGFSTLRLCFSLLEIPGF